MHQLGTLHLLLATLLATTATQAFLHVAAPARNPFSHSSSFKLVVPRPAPYRWPPSPSPSSAAALARRHASPPQEQQQDKPPAPVQSGNVLDELERRLKGHGLDEEGNDESPPFFSYVTTTPAGGKQRIPLPPNPNTLLITFSIVMAMSLGLLGILVGHFVGVPVVASLGHQPLIGFARGATLSLPLFAVDAVLQGTQEDTASEVYALSIFGSKTPVPIVLALAAAVTLATGIGEELLFRGLIQQGLAGVVGPWAGLALASGIFGLAHKLGPSDVLFITLSGAYMGFTFLQGDLMVPIALHACYDLFILMSAYFRAKQRLAGGK